ncbi:Piso0_000739 [Millerozyma farinosa CBS 7064]|uniref:Piso0_000739 protein n=1 Tax=Pichia sorbitophila (strain ATCC MYA-4447 / BCRC 22081 / CBS 7064 / NBRC 10061 / NRRL Y-12695) TaxID=559304 RepID=G8YRD7_PICSO|nr:Piso0_000739 [Millerozyma farinosa CBS 7064]
MEGDRTSFYIHGNNSTSSTIHNPSIHGQSQVSSVGFNTLKKSNSNSSESSLTTNSTIKTNPLARLFTRTKSSSNLSPPYLQSQQDLQKTDDHYDQAGDDDSISIAESKKSTGSKILNFSKNKLKITGKNAPSKPDLKIQTSGHHGLRFPKKILSASSLDESNNLTGRAVSSPVSTIHNLFNRNYNGSQPNKDSHNSSKDDKQSMNNQGRTAIALSSNSSNSFITDSKFASVYKFTDPNYIFEDPENSTEHTTLHDLPKKLMLPTDQYIQQKRGKHHASEVGLGISHINATGGDSLNRSTLEFGKEHKVFFEQLLAITKPLFSPSQQYKLSNGQLHPYLVMSLEEISAFVKENYVNSVSDTPTSDTHERRSRSRSNSNKIGIGFNYFGSNSTLSLHDNSEIYDDFKVREISQDLTAFFEKCLQHYQKDFVTYEHSLRGKIKAQDNKRHHLAEHLAKEWRRMREQWLYFNEKIRFAMTIIFQPLQRELREFSLQRFKAVPSEFLEIDVESILLSIYREIMIIPVLINRNIEYQNLKNNEEKDSPESTQLSSTSHRSVSTVVRSQEEDILKMKDNELVKVLLNCFGTLMSHSSSQWTKPDGDYVIASSPFVDTFSWLSSLL